MENQKKPNRYLVTTALPYANGPLHIGHLAGCYIPADIFVRHLRTKRDDVLFIGGSDEHGVPITIRAMREGRTPKEVVDQYHELIKSSLEGMGISYDIYSRTSNPTHHKTSSDFFLDLYNKGLLEEKETEQFYDEEKKVFLADRYIVGTCPICGYENAYGDQCEKCGSSLSPEELINPRSALSDAIPVKKKTKHWYFPLNHYNDFLKEFVLEGHKEWKPNVYGQCKSWLDMGLKSRAITRDSDWGVKVPLPNTEGKVLYVWFDAVLGYISATKELTPKWQDYWCQDDTKLIHFIGKDNIVFHCLMFPAMLKAHGGYVLQDNVPANEFLNIEGQKVSTSRNWAVWVDEYLKDFPDMQDVLRYVLCANAPETKDNDFTWKDFQDRNNNELVAILGNFFNRTFVLMHKLTNGKVPPLHGDVATKSDQDMVNEFAKTKERMEELFMQYKLREALSVAMDLARKGNRYLQENEPWILAKQVDENGKIKPEAQKRIDMCIHVCLQTCANLAIFFYPFIPFTVKKMLHMMKVVPRMLFWENAGKPKLLSVGYSLRAPELLFRKIENEEIEVQLGKLGNKSDQNKEDKQMEKDQEIVEGNLKPEINFDDFSKIDLRTGTILTAEKMEKSNKLLKFRIDLGFEQRTILSGVAKQFSPEELIGKKVVIVANLKPRKMMGIESNGMILMAEDGEGKLHFLSAATDGGKGSPIS